ncbi:c-type cytochrome [Neorhizobium sp. NCHU2750]|uniref:c-type cytochrome n=1 Tax=Neorhizobium sp. NCHU2750 TaxID=1825976 RepID=UPI000E72327B|nr:cytochrome c [Neorhizobium sp. NCHU2750]
MPFISSRTRSKLLAGIGGLAILGVAGFLVVTSPWTWSLIHPSRDVADAGPANLENGREIFLAGDCSTCHATPGKGDPLNLGGGRVLDTAFGKFHMPNISPDPVDGIGNWSLAEFTRAVREGVGPAGLLPDGENLYPAFPYTSYQRLSANDVRDMFAYIKSLQPVSSKVPAHELKFPYNLRRGIGVWRLAFLDGEPVADSSPKINLASASADTDASVAVLQRGQYLVEGPGHCAECHSARTFMGNVPEKARYGGGATPDGKGHFPNISPDETGIGFWSANSIADYLKSGVSPIGKIAGGDMAEVIENTSKLSNEDRHAMAAYLKSLPPVHNLAPGMPEPNYTDKVVMLAKATATVVSLPTSQTSALASTDDAFVVTTKPFYLNEQDVGSKADPAGKFLGAAKLQILKRDGDKLQVRLAGWQLQGAESVFYQAQGQRIMQAVLGDNAIATVKSTATQKDADTGQVWHAVNIDGWIDAQNLNTQLPELWQYSSTLFGNTCSVCHVLPESNHFLANQWVGTLKAMKRFTSLSDDQYRLLLAYLQNHSKDVHMEQAQK